MEPGVGKSFYLISQNMDMNPMPSACEDTATVKGEEESAVQPERIAQRGLGNRFVKPATS
jgi:hypothetical protein